MQTTTEKYEGYLVPLLKGMIGEVTNSRTDDQYIIREKINLYRKIRIDESQYNLGLEMSEVYRFYNTDLVFTGSLNFDNKFEEEREHYLSLKHTMLHQIRKTKYFFNEGTHSRKNIIFSDDCISSIQFIERIDGIYLNVYMRSSDVVRLLPLDILFINRLLRDVMHENNITFGGRQAVISLNIASAHIAKEDDVLRFNKAIFS